MATNAYELLQPHLTPREYNYFRKHNKIKVRGGKTGRIYIIDPGAFTMNVSRRFRLLPIPFPFGRYCIVKDEYRGRISRNYYKEFSRPDKFQPIQLLGYPYQHPATLLAIVLMIKGDEQRFFRTAVHFTVEFG